MKLGKRKITTRTGTRDVRTTDETAFRRVLRPNPLRTGRFSRKLHRQPSRRSCQSLDCEEKDRVLTPDEGIVRVQLGYITYEKYVRFAEEFPVNPHGEVEAYLHATCAMEGGMRIQSLKLDKCCLCGRQFFCHEEPKECCVFIQHGHFEDDEFVAIHDGAVHWCCADWHWGEDITSVWRGPYADEQSSR